MKKTGIVMLLALTAASFQTFAANDVYGTVSEINHRSNSAQNDHSVYIRLALSEAATSTAQCAQSAANLIWHLDLTSPVANYQYELLKTSYKEQLPVRIIGQADVCANGPTDYDTIIEISPWSWPSIIEQRNLTPQVTGNFL
ncbi:hypothetical protein ORJ66_16665 [Pseudoalteromonas tunicata]|uniref:hypothetical protein n=1 Tax=Pseudoalteromonas tunicata TaxID=314281 RepID=UPI00273D9375|nr:hypothetical protein [Pseudoalteromonas tunicata]MDP5214684.1 hypothetical protein [Pseudoalteromonas tunicata]